MPGYFASLRYGLWLLKDTPKDVIAKLNPTMVQVLADPQVLKRIAELWRPNHAARPAIAGSFASVPESRKRTPVADHQGVEYQGGLKQFAAGRRWPTGAELRRR